MKKTLICIFIATLLFTLRAAGDEIQLDDGTKVTGKIVTIADDVFLIRTNYGDIKIPRTKILSVNFPENQENKTATANSFPVVKESLHGSSYVNQTSNFQLVVPPGWALAPELRAKDVMGALKSPDDTLFVMITPEKFVGILPTYKVLLETHLQETFRDYEKLSEEEATIDGKRGLCLTFVGKPADKNVLLKFLVYIVPYKDRMVRLSFLTLEPLFTDAIPVFQKIASSYHSTESASLVSDVPVIPK